MKTSEQIDKLVPALIAAKGGLPLVTKGGVNDFHKYSYARLEDYARVAYPVLNENELVVMESAPQVMFDENTKCVRVWITLRLIHKSGQWIETECVGEGQDKGDKATYKALTGARKYGIAMLLGMVTTDDPEADASTDRELQQSTRPTPPRDNNDGKAAVMDAIKEWTGFKDATDIRNAVGQIRAAAGLSDKGQLNKADTARLAAFVGEHKGKDFFAFIQNGAAK